MPRWLQIILGLLVLILGFLFVRPPKLSQGAQQVADTLRLLGKKFRTEVPFLVNGHRYRFDFQVDNTFIEFDGRQHFEYIPYFYKTRQQFREAQQRDRIKTAAALQRGYSVVRIDYTANIPWNVSQGLSSTGLYLSHPHMYQYLSK